MYQEGWFIVDRRAEELGLDRPVVARYGTWLRAALRGDFGRRAVEQTSVRTLLWQRLQVTLRKVTTAIVAGAGFVAFARDSVPVLSETA